MRISRDVTFDESRPFYPRPSFSAFSVEDISFLLFPDTPPSVPIDPPPHPSLPMSHPPHRHPPHHPVILLPLLTLHLMGS
jgi:hypothetical protein